MSRVLCVALFLSCWVPNHYSQSEPADGWAGFLEQARAFCRWFDGREKVEKALDFFSEKAFSNANMLCEDCAGYLRDADRQYPAMVRLAVRRFLLDFRHEFRHHRSKTDYFSAVRKYVEREGQQIISSVNDPFVGVFLHREELKTLASDWRCADNLVKTLPTEECCKTYHQVGEGIIYFLWIRENGRWQIFHAGMECQ